MMESKMMKIGFLSNIVTAPFIPLLNRYLKELNFQSEIKDYDIDQIPQILKSKITDDYLILILDNTFFFDNFIDDRAFEKVDLLEGLLIDFKKKNHAKVILSNVFYTFSDFNSFFNMEQYNKLYQLNTKIEDISNKVSNISILNLFNLGSRIGFDNFMRLKNKFLFQSPFSKNVIEVICKEICRHVYIYEKGRKKVCVVDADNTLWGGIVGEDGVDNIQIDENYPGIVYKYFQNQLKALKDSGILLCLVSKNNAEEIEDVFLKRRMPLKLSDFVIKKVNWAPKSENILEIAKELNLGLESFVFIDDSKFEIAEVTEKLKVIECYHFDINNVESNLNLLERIFGFYATKITKEDISKTQQYFAEKKRTDIRKQFTTSDDFIKSLDIEIFYSINDRAHIPRISQLTNKTNQFNLTTKRYSETDIEKLMKNHLVFDFKVVDKFGDMGIVGVVIVKDDVIDTFLLSCRVLGRKIEEKIIQIVQKEVQVEKLKGVYIETSKNEQVKELYDRLGFKLVYSGRKRREYELTHRVKDVTFIKSTKMGGRKRKK